MNILSNARSSFKICLTLTVLLTSLILTSFFEKQHLKSIDECFSSIFADRLVPATDMFLIADQLYQKRMMLQSFLLASEETELIPLQEQNLSIDSLLAKYKETYLVNDEVVCLKTLIAKWKAYQIHEAKILALMSHQDRDQALLLFNTTGKDLFSSIIADLEQLTRIQSQVGANLMDTSKSNIASTNSLLTFQSSIIIIVALITNFFLLTAKAVVQPGQKFHLN